MQAIVEEIKHLYYGFRGIYPDSIEKIPQSGSNRIYFRITEGDQSWIGTWNNNIKENRAFLYFSRHLLSKGCAVPEIYAVNTDESIYIQQDFGDNSLMAMLEKHGPNEQVFELFSESLKSLAYLQIMGDEDLDYSWCITSPEFGKQAILSDLLYFKYYFLDTLQIPYDKEKLIDDFEALSIYLTRVDYKYFMFRDFQSRNIMVNDRGVNFIDFQGGMKGALQYDVASMLWQAKAGLSEDWKNRLLNFYIDCVEINLDKKIDRQRFIGQYNGYVLIRLLQVLGAYGFRGLFERKAHFLTSIPLGLKNLKSFLTDIQINIALPEFERLLNLVVSENVIQRFEPLYADDLTPLVVSINSFSYKKGLPVDPSGNGGGFIFDCRGILNPGRIERFKVQTGRDRAVKDFLEQQTKMPDFLNSVFDVTDIAVEDYIKRGFASLQINFGCTGGQHRSVYAADALARHLRNKFKVKIDLHHIEQEAKNWINSY